jgi:sugar lactone lactonase YvrE
MDMKNETTEKIAVPKVLLKDRIFVESARWHEGRFWFADWGTREIIAVDRDGRWETMVRLQFKAFPICFDWLPNGQLLVLSSSERPLLRQEPDGRLVDHADLGHLGIGGWNEIAVDHKGNAYINGGNFSSEGKPQPGIIALVTPDGRALQVADGIDFPNGMILTPDGSTLIIAESYGRNLTAFSVEPDGSLSGRRVWADLGNGVPDGICMGPENSIWYADVPNASCTRVREGGEVLATIRLDRGCFSCALGGESQDTLFIVATVWKGFQHMFEGERTGQVVAVSVRE